MAAGGELMTSITIADAVHMQTQFAALNPPRQVMSAVNTITTLAAVGGRVPTDLITYVQGWIQRQQRVDRFGKDAS